MENLIYALYFLYNAFIEMLASTVFILPLSVLYAVLYCRKMRAQNPTRPHLVRTVLYRTVLQTLLWYYLTAVVAIVGFPDITSFSFDVTLNLVPFRHFISDFTNTGLNILLFIPLGIFLPLLWNRFRRLKRLMLCAFAYTFFIEVAQLFCFRTTDINDIITNLLGAFLGYLIVRAASKDFSRLSGSSENRLELLTLSAFCFVLHAVYIPFVLPALYRFFPL